MKALFERLQLLFPGRRIFFIYTHKNGQDRFGHGLNANTELSYWNFQALKKQFRNVFFLRLQGEKEHRIRSIRSTDIVIGHVGETFLRAAARTKKMIAFYPWCGHLDRSTNTLFNCLPKEKEFEYLERSRAAIFLTSEYNVARYIDSEENFWYAYLKKFALEKRLRIVHQPLDFTFFTRIKHDYHTSDFLYVGNEAHMKCLPDSKALVRAVNRKLHIYGAHGSKLNHLNSTEVSKLANLADFFIQPGMWEAQSVAILEAAAYGFIPIVSPQTGYPYTHPFALRYNDFEYNKKVLRDLLETTSDERKKLADELHSRLLHDSKHNDWKNLTQVIVEEVINLNSVS